MDGESIGEMQKDVMREREQLSRSGIVFIDISLDKHTGRLCNPPEIITRGFISVQEAPKITSRIQKKVSEIVNEAGYPEEKTITDAIRSFLFQETRRRPFIMVTLSKI